MKSVCRLLLALCAPVLFLGAAKKPAVTVRFHVEANANDTERFATPVELKHPPRKTYIERVPSINERYIKAIYPFPAADGSWGCAFKLDTSGRTALEVLSTERRGTSIVAFVGTKLGVHQVIDMQIDARITDGIISIPRGLTKMEIEILQKQFPTIGAGPKKS